MEIEKNKFISQHTKNEITKRQTAPSMIKLKAATIMYFIPQSPESVQVCKNSFVNTLGISKFKVSPKIWYGIASDRQTSENRGHRKAKLFVR